MNKKELLFLAVGVFITIMAWMILDFYHISEKKYINREFPPVQIPAFNINTKIFPTLDQMQP